MSFRKQKNKIRDAGNQKLLREAVKIPRKIPFIDKR